MLFIDNKISVFCIVLVSCDKFWIKFIASLVSTKKLHPEMKLHRHGIYCANGKIQS